MGEFGGDRVPWVPMRVVLHPLDGIAPALVSAWSALADRAAEPNPFFEPLYVLPAVRLFGNGRTTALLAVHRGDAMVGAVPVVHQPSWRRIAWPTWATLLRPHGAPLGTPLIDGAHLADAARALAGASGRLGGGLLALEWTRVDGPVGEALVAASRGTSSGARPILYHRFRRGALRSGHRPNFSEARRRRCRTAAARLAAGGGTVPMPHDRPPDLGAVDEFLELERSGWKRDQRTPGPAGSASVEFLREVVAGFGAEGRMRLMAIEHAGRPVAMAWHVTARGAEFCFATCYDESWKRAAPGIHVVAAAIEAAAATGASVDSCTDPETQYLLDLMPDRVEIGSLLFPPRGPEGVALTGAIRALVASRDRRNARRGVSGDLP